MRRLALICGLFLTLTAGVWSSAPVAASAWCLHEASATSAPDEHDCCRAKIGESNARHTAAQDASHDDAAHETSNARQTDGAAHSEMDCAQEAEAPPEIGVAARGGQSCAECCAGGSGQTPATAVVVAPEQTRVKRDAVSESARARQLFAPAPPHLSHLAPSQHAPPAPLERRHLLLGVFLI